MFLLFIALVSQAESAPKSKWEKEISRIEKQHAEKKPAKGSAVFFGSSTIRLWKLDKSFPRANVANCGFGGSTFADTAEFAKRVVVPLDPSVVVLYSGDNDIASKRKPERVLADFKKTVDALRGKLPDVKIVVLGIKPSIKRWAMWPDQKEANRLIAEECAAGKDMIFIDLAPVVLGENGEPMPEMFLKDQLHLSEKAYAKMAKILMEKKLIPMREDG